MGITLTKDMGANSLEGMSKLEIGASWDRTAGTSGGLLGRLKKERGVDLDLLCIAMQGSEPVRMAGLDSLDPMQNGSVIHSGDNQTGKGDGDDELVSIDFAKVPSNVTGFIVVAAAFKNGSSLEKASNVSFKVYDSSGGAQTQVADIWPSMLSKDNACAVCKVDRDPAYPSQWNLTVLNVMGKVTQGDKVSLMRFAIGK